MKRYMAAVSLFAASTGLYALDCGNLGIRIRNNSPHHCVLKHVNLIDGYFQSQAPLSIPSNTSTSTFYLKQSDNGVRVELDYRCDGNTVIIDSQQEYCGFMAGYVWAYAYNGNDMVTEHQEMMGSYWSSRPGQIQWIIH